MLKQIISHYIPKRAPATRRLVSRAWPVVRKDLKIHGNPGNEEHSDTPERAKEPKWRKRQFYSVSVDSRRKSVWLHKCVHSYNGLRHLIDRNLGPGAVCRSRMCSNVLQK